MLRFQLSGGRVLCVNVLCMAYVTLAAVFITIGTGGNFLPIFAGVVLTAAAVLTWED